MATRLPLALTSSLLIALAACGKDEPMDKYTCPEDAPVISCDPGSTLSSGGQACEALLEDQDVAAFDGPYKEVLCAGWQASGRPLDTTPQLVMLPRGEFNSARNSHPEFKGRDVPGFILHNPAAGPGREECIVMPTDNPPGEFVEVMQHEVGHVRQQEKGEQEAELAELVQGLALAQLNPVCGRRILEGLFDVRQAGSGGGHPPNTLGHAHALMALANLSGDVAAAHAALAGWTNERGMSELKADCACEDPLSDAAYEALATRFVDSLTDFPPAPGADADEGLADIQAFLRWRLAYALDYMREGPFDYMTTVNATKEYVTARSGPGVYHLAIVQAVTEQLAAAASPQGADPPDVATRLVHWRDTVASSLHYPTRQGDDDDVRHDRYLRAYALAAGWAAAASPPDEDTVEFMSDTFLARHGEAPSETCERQVAAEVFFRRGTIEFGVRDDADAAKPWFLKAQTLLGWSAEEDCAVSYAEIEAAVNCELQKIDGGEDC